MYSDINPVLKRILSPTKKIDDFNYDNMIAPPLLSLLTVDDINYLHYLATSVKLSAKIKFKYEEIDKLMRFRGFKKLSAGTNRVVYRCLFNQNIVLKIAVDSVALADNPREFKNQEYLKPFCCKIFEVSPCGTVAVVERVHNIKNRDEFASMSDMVYDLLRFYITGRFLMEDIGTKYFMNYGWRENFGPLLLDYPYMYELDGNKLICNQEVFGEPCGGEIDYDAGFNEIYCTKCHTVYRAHELAKKIEFKDLIVKKGTDVIMEDFRIVVKRGSKVIKTSDDLGKRKISKRERIYNSLPKIDDFEVKVNKPNATMVTAINKALEESKVEEQEEVTSVVEESVNEVAVEEVAESSSTKFDIDSTFIPEEVPEEEKSELYKKIENVFNSGMNEDDEETDNEEKHLNLDPPDDYNEDEDDNTNLDAIPVGAVPIGNVRRNNGDKPRSKRFDPDFYSLRKK